MPWFGQLYIGVAIAVIVIGVGLIGYVAWDAWRR